MNLIKKLPKQPRNIRIIIIFFFLGLFLFQIKPVYALDPDSGCNLSSGWNWVYTTSGHGCWCFKSHRGNADLMATTKICTEGDKHKDSVKSGKHKCFRHRGKWSIFQKGATWEDWKHYPAKDCEYHKLNLNQWDFKNR